MDRNLLQWSVYTQMWFICYISQGWVTLIYAFWVWTFWYKEQSSLLHMYVLYFVCLTQSWKYFSLIEIQQTYLSFQFIGLNLHYYLTEPHSHLRNFHILKKKFEYIIHFPFIWRLSHVLFKTKKMETPQVYVSSTYYCCHL